MTKHAAYDAVTGLIVGYYDTAIHSDIPAPSIEVPDDLWPQRTSCRVDVSGDTPVMYVHRPTVDGATLKARAISQITAEAEVYRAMLANVRPGKQAEYRIKEAIARDPSSATEAELALLDREAAAFGTDRAGLIALILQEVGTYRQLALLIAAMEAEAKAAIRSIDDAAEDADQQIETALDAAKAQAEQAFVQATTAINGG